MTREGSPWTGLWAVTLKELADHLSSIRMQLLEGLIFLTALGSAYAAAQELRATVAEDPFLYLKLFTTAREPLPSFIAFLSFLIPLVAIALGFDAINGEHNRRTLSRILSQPIYRDAVLLGKFLAALGTIALNLLALWLLVTGLGLLRLGVVPSGEEVARGLLFLLATLGYAGIWLALAMMFSVIFRQPATSALASIAVWLFVAVFWDIIVGLVAGVVRPVEGGTPFAELAHTRLRLGLSRLSPNTLYAEVLLVLLNPEVRSLGPVFLAQLEGAVLGTPLPLGQSLLLAWPQFTGLLAATLVLFAGGYVLFQRQEVRA
ncbi:MAG: ABC transporter permease [Armatimonadota bacterium]|nr:ABC transporter permease [Armatimonadota bacterium]MDR7451716.1 ABC transporter permease [Armatimonadota bacterium]MDR7465666.1 ABC transporter permease [Armatimonadota bacterium]MDR7493575.1 ABC transporter permease [Armatimonadota bacterium]MDR7499521.1 ABC transporter permease [Armatimonadota bacterium]